MNCHTAWHCFHTRWEGKGFTQGFIEYISLYKILHMQLIFWKLKCPPLSKKTPNLSRSDSYSRPVLAGSKGPRAWKLQLLEHGIICRNVYISLSFDWNRTILRSILIGISRWVWKWSFKNASVIFSLPDLASKRRYCLQQEDQLLTKFFGSLVEPIKRPAALKLKGT